jgi:cardiolipin synthase
VPGFSDSNVVLQAARGSYEELLQNGVCMFERKDALLHIKDVVIDGTVTMSGSANLDVRNFLHNDEVNAIIIGRDSAWRLEHTFERDEKAAREVDLERWQTRSFWQRAVS